LYLERKNCKYQQRLGHDQLQRSSAENDLGVLVEIVYEPADIYGQQIILQTDLCSSGFREPGVDKVDTIQTFVSSI